MGRLNKKLTRKSTKDRKCFEIKGLMDRLRGLIQLKEYYQNEVIVQKVLGERDR